MKDQISETALANVGLGAIAKAGRSDETPGWCAIGVSRASRSQRYVESLGRVVANILRQEIDEAVRISIDPNRLFCGETFDADVPDYFDPISRCYEEADAWSWTSPSSWQ